jgi:uncharacterized protein
MNWLQEYGFSTEDLNQPGKYQDTPIILASRQGREDMVTELLAQGVNINHRNMDGTNALWAAVVANDFAIADKLLAAGVDIDNLNDNGASVLMYASSTGKSSWVLYLLNQGADIDAESLDGFTALELASDIACLRLLRKWKQLRKELEPQS